MSQNENMPKINNFDNNMLEWPITLEELYNVIIEMCSNKSPGSDGIPIEFYVVFWEKIR